MIPVKAMLNQLTCWVDVVEDCVCVAWVRGSENANFEVLVRVFKYFLCVRAYIETSIEEFATGHGHVKDHVGFFQ